MLVAVFMIIVNELSRAELKRKEKNGSMKRCLNKLVPKILIIAEAL
jgi:hypothetical protein